MDDEHGFRDICRTPDCPVCLLFPYPDEDRAAWRERVAAQWHGKARREPPMMAEITSAPAFTTTRPDPLAGRIAARLADLEQQERDALKAIRAAQDRLIGVRGGIAVLRELAADTAPGRARTIDAPAPALAAPVPSETPDRGRWSRAHDRCVDCERTTVPHGGAGRCRNCYERFRRESRTEAAHD